MSNPYETKGSEIKPRPKFLYKAGAYRTSYNIQTAAKCLAFFRAAASTCKDTLIPYELIGGNSPKTWQQKLNDGLLFLVNESLREWDELPPDIENNLYWMKFRMSVKFRPELEEGRVGVWILFKNKLFENSVRGGTINQPVIADPGALTPEQVQEAVLKHNQGDIMSPKEVEVQREVNTLKSDWQRELISFITGEDTSRTFIKSDLKLTPEEIVWIHERIGDLQIDKVVRTDTIRLLRR